MSFNLRKAFNAGIAAYGGAYAFKAAQAHDTETMLLAVGIAVANVVMAGVTFDKRAPSPQ
jgi:hypothetical protein